LAQHRFQASRTNAILAKGIVWLAV
jgi:hypothetical protein